jgi:hypothetical protein
MSDIGRHLFYFSNTMGLLVDRIGPIVKPLQEAFELPRDRFHPFPGLRRDEQAWGRTRSVR